MARSYTIFHIHVDTVRFTFDAYGRTEEEAREALTKGWKKHCRETRANPDDLNVDGQYVAKVKLGSCYRDV